jgi:hypothetical protein
LQTHLTNANIQSYMNMFESYHFGFIFKSYLGLLHCISISSPIIQTLLSHFLTIGIKSKLHIYNITLLILNIPKALKSNYCNILCKLHSHNFARIIPKIHPWYPNKQKPIQNAYVNRHSLASTTIPLKPKKMPNFKQIY